MAVKFADLMKMDAGENLYTAMVEEIDSALVRAAKNGGIMAHVVCESDKQYEGVITVSFNGFVTQRAKNRLDREYTLAGWKVKNIEPSSRGQSCIEFYIKF